MKSRGRTVRQHGRVSAESDLVRSMEALDQAEPGWDESVRILGIVRRLERDSSVLGVQAAIDVYGEESVFLALPCADLHAADGEVIGKDGRVRYRSREKLQSVQRKQVADISRFFGDELSDDEVELLHALLCSGKTPRQVANELHASETRVMRLHNALLKILGLSQRTKILPKIDLDMPQFSILYAEAAKIRSLS